MDIKELKNIIEQLRDDNPEDFKHNEYALGFLTGWNEALDAILFELG